MPIDPEIFAANEAWLLFQLNDAPVRTQADGDFDVLGVMDVATGLILGLEFIGSTAIEPSEFESRKLFASAASEAGRKPVRLYVSSEQKMMQPIVTAKAMGLAVIVEAEVELSPLAREAREGFAARVSGARKQWNQAKRSCQSELNAAYLVMRFALDRQQMRGGLWKTGT